MLTDIADKASVHSFYDREGFKLFPLGDKYQRGWDRSQMTAEQVRQVLEVLNYSRFGWVVPQDWLILDADPRNGGNESLVQLCKDIQLDLVEYVGQIVATGSGGRHLYMRFPAEIHSRKTLEQYPGLDFLRSQPSGKAINVVGAGSLPLVEKGQTQPYSMIKHGSWDVPCPDPLVEMLRYTPAERSTEPLSAEDIEMARAAVLRIPGEYAEGRDEWIRIGMACKAVDESLFDAWVTWSEKASSFVSVEDCRDRWEGFSPSGEIGIGTLKFLSLGAQPTPEESFGHLVIGGTFVQPPTESVVLDNVIGEFWNYKNIKNKDGDKIKAGRTMPEMVNEFLAIGWPRSCRGELFAPDTRRGVRILSTTSELFSWIQLQKKVYWAEKGDKIGREQFCCGLRDAVPQYDSIAVAPHYPPIKGVYYVNDIPPGRVEDLYEFIDHFSPASPEDRELMIAAVVTPFWGGAGGQRPLFVVTSEDAQGAGKSTFVQAISRLTGLGKPLVHQIRNAKGFEELPRAMGSAAPTSPESSRMVAIDNYRGAALGSTDIESMITETVLSVWKLYSGEVRVPNLFTWFVTGNFIDMSEDLAQRSVEIKIEKPDSYSADWSEALLNWDLEKVVSGIGAFFQLPKTTIDSPLRFDLWSREVLGRLKEPKLLAEIILGRHDALSVLSDDVVDLRRCLLIYAKARGSDLLMREGRIVVPVSNMAGILNHLGIRDPNGRHWSSRFLSRCLKTAAKQLDLEPYRSNTYRGFLWHCPAEEIAQFEPSSSAGDTPSGS